MAAYAVTRMALGALLLGAAALLGMVVCIAMLISHRSKRNR